VSGSGARGRRAVAEQQEQQRMIDDTRPNVFSTTRLSVVVPLFNEEDSVEPLYRAVVDALAQFSGWYEIVLVDDGSSDKTFETAARLAADDPRLKVIKFRANFGQTPAMAAGIDHAVGDVIVTMDGDLQNDPNDILMLVAELEKGNDLVVGWRFNRQDKLVTRKIPSVIANRLIGRVTGVPIKDNGCSLKAFRASVIKSISLYSEMHRFIPAMASVVGPRIAEVKVRHHARRFGQSKYGLSRIYRVLLDLMIVKTVTSFAERPLVWFAILAMPAFVLGVVLLLAGTAPLLGAAGTLSLPVAGSGLLMLSLAGTLICAGAFGELVFATGDLRPSEFAAPTLKRFSGPGVISSQDYKKSVQ
jgi:glycosyltransferase involved in cell wall biosynthesis